MAFNQTWASGFCTVPLATSHRAHEFEHVLKDSDPELIIIGGHVCRNDDEDKVSTAKTLPPHNEGELLQAVNNVGLADRVVYLRDLLKEDEATDNMSAVATSETGTEKYQYEFNLGAHAIPSMDTPSMIMYTSGSTGLPKAVLTSQ